MRSHIFRLSQTSFFYLFMSFACFAHNSSYVLCADCCWWCVCIVVSGVIEKNSLFLYSFFVYQLAVTCLVFGPHSTLTTFFVILFQFSNLSEYFSDYLLRLLYFFSLFYNIEKKKFFFKCERLSKLWPYFSYLF